MLPTSQLAAHERMKGAARASGDILMLLSNAFSPDPRVHAEARALVESGYNVTVLGWDRDCKERQREVLDDINIIRVFVRSIHGRGISQAFIMPVVYVLMAAEARQLRFEAVHAHDFDMLPLAVLLAAVRRVPLVYDSHEDYVGMLHGSIPAWFGFLIHFVETALLRRVNLLITVGDKLRDEFIRRGCPHAIVVGNWKSLKEYKFDFAAHLEVRQQLGIPESALVICFIANLGRERHVRELLQAVAVRPTVHLIIGGAGPETDAIREAALRHDNIHFVGFVNPKSISRYTSAADVLFYGFDVHNPNARYSAPNKLFEGLAAGLPLISAHFGEIERILIDHQCGILLENFTIEEIGRAIDQCANRENLKVLGDNAAKAGRQHFNWCVAETRLLDAYRRLLDNVGGHKAGCE